MSAFGRDEDTAAGGTATPDVPPGTATSPVGETPPASGGSGAQAVPRTRAGGLWVALAAFGILLLFLLIFILQNLQVASVHFLGARWRVPVGAALLLAAVLGILLAAMAGTARIIQLRLLARRRAASAPATTAPPPGTAVAVPEDTAAPDAPPGTPGAPR